MKKIPIMSLILLLCLTACSMQKGTKYPTDNDYHAETDSHYMCEPNPDISMTESPDGYYMRLGDTVYFIDKTSLCVSPLCSKPNCRHQNETDPEIVYQCDAYIGMPSCPFFLEYIEGCLYVTVPETLGSFENQLCIMRMKPDGTQRKIICRLPANTEACVIHRGYIYCASGIFSEDMQASYGVQRIPLTGGDTEVVYASQEKGGSVQSLKAFGNYIYFKERTASASRQMFWNTQTGELGQTIPDEKQKVVQMPEFFQGHLLSRVYCYDDPEKPENGYNVWYITDPDGRNQQQMYLENAEKYAFHFLKSDGSSLWRYVPFFYAGRPNVNWVFQKLDENGHVVAELSDPADCHMLDFIPGGENTAFLFDIEPGEKLENEFVLYAVDKNPSDGILRKQEIFRCEYSNLRRRLHVSEDAQDTNIAERG